MTEEDSAKRPIFVIKKKITHGGQHGGAWKVAYADFVTAMMALFIVLWLLNTTPQIQKAVGGYFNDPRGQANKTGTDKLGAGSNISIDKSTVEKLKAQIQKAILQQKDLVKLSKQVEITITGEGLRVELIEGKGGTFFESGSAKLSEGGTKLLEVLAEQLKGLPNHLTIEGHTDAQPYASDTGYTNWELSTDRANAARRVLQQYGLQDNQISQVRGYADQMLRVKSDPLDASNRRITLIVQWVEVPQSTAPKEVAGAAGEPAASDAPSAKAKSAGEAAKGKEETAAPATAPAAPAAAPAASGLAAKPSAAVARPGLLERAKQMLPGKK
jgi:chemotaxis protein MotB